MKRSLRVIAVGILSFVSLAVPITVAAARTAQDSTAKDDVKDAGHSVKKAGKDTGHAAKKAGSATKKETKKVVNKSAEKTKEGAGKVEKKTEPNQ